MSSDLIKALHAKLDLEGLKQIAESEETAAVAFAVIEKLIAVAEAADNRSEHWLDIFDHIKYNERKEIVEVTDGWINPLREALADLRAAVLPDDAYEEAMKSETWGTGE